LLPVALADDLEDFLARGGRRVEDWQQGHRLAVADFSERPEAFANVNTPEELQRFAAREAGAGADDDEIFTASCLWNRLGTG